MKPNREPEPFDLPATSLEEEIEDMFDSQTETEEIEGIINENIVAGLYENEIQLEPLCSSNGYSPLEIEEHLESYFRFFSKVDMDLIYMYFIGDKTQMDLQAILHKTQPAISCTVDRIQKQIGAIVKIRGMVDEFIRFISDPKVRLAHRDRNILLVFFYSTSIIKTSQIIGISHMVCRARIDAAIEVLKETGQKRIYKFFEYILEHLNKVKKNVSEEVIIENPGKHDYPSGHISQELPL